MTQGNPALSYLVLPWTWSIALDAESNCWVATIAELPDFFAAGATAGEAAANAREALISHFSGYLRTGTPIPLPKARASWEPSNGVTPGAQLIEVEA